MLSIVPIVMAITMTVVMIIRVIAPVSTVRPVIVGVVAIMVVTIYLAEVASMTVGIVTPTALRRVMLLVREISVVLVAAKLPLAVFFLPDIVVQSDGLVQQCLIVGGIRH